MALKPLTDSATCQSLAKHYEAVKNLHLRKLFAEDPARADKFTVEGAGLSCPSEPTGLRTRSAPHGSGARAALQPRRAIGALERSATPATAPIETLHDPHRPTPALPRPQAPPRVPWGRRLNALPVAAVVLLLATPAAAASNRGDGKHSSMDSEEVTG